MTVVRVMIRDELVYECSTTVVPRVGDYVEHGDRTLRVESAVWALPTDEGPATVTLVVNPEPYSF